MKSVTVLIGLVLMLCTGTAQASSEPFLSSSDAISAHQADQSHNVPERETPFPTQNPDSGFTGDEVIAASEPLTVLDYVISPQATIDLECRPFTSESGLEFLSEGLDVGQITQNFMLGFRYKF